MFTHLDDPSPPIPGRLQRDAVARLVTRRRRRQLAIPVTMLAIVIAGLAALAAVRSGRHTTQVAVGDNPGRSRPSRGGSRVSAAPVSAPSNPAIFAIVQGQRLQVRSATTGELVRELGGDAAGLSLSADGSTLYYEGLGGPLDPFPIYRIPTTGGQRVQVASGEDPAISPDGASLAYATGDGHAIAIEDFTRHTTRRIELESLIGRGASFKNTPAIVTWLNDNRLVAIPRENPTLNGAPTSTSLPAGRPATCTAAYQQQRQCAIVVDVDVADPAHLVMLGAVQGITAAGPGSTGNTLLIGSFVGRIAVTTITQYAITATNATVIGTQTMPDQEEIVGFSPTGRQVLYLRNHGPVQLWVGTIATQVTPTRELLADAALGSVSW